MSFENLRLNRLVAHQIYREPATGQSKAPLLSEEIINLDVEGVQTLSDRITEAVSNDSYCLRMDVVTHGEGSTFQRLVGLIGLDDDRFVEESKVLAHRLDDAQTSRTIPDSVLVVADGTIRIANNPVVIVIKAETHAGFNLERNRRGLLLNFLNDLLLTPQARLYKVGMFIDSGTAGDSALRSPDDFDVFVFDHNLKRRETKAAKYFYRGFLHCDYAQTDKLLTQQFYFEGNEVIQALPVGDADKIDLVNDLASYMRSQRNMISTVDFAEEYLPEEVRPNFIQAMEDRDFPGHAVAKDVSFIKRRLKTRNLKFSNGVKLVGPSDDFDNQVEILETAVNHITLKINGGLRAQA